MSKTNLRILVTPFIVVLSVFGCATPRAAGRQPASEPPPRAAALPDAEDRFGMTLAMHAAARGDLALLQTLTGRGLDLRHVNGNGASVLYFAAQAQTNAVAIFEFVRAKLGPRTFAAFLGRRVFSNGHTVAMEAVFNLNEKVVDYLLGLRGQGVLVDFASPTVFGWTPRTFAEREKMPMAARLPEGSVAVADRAQWLRTQQEAWLSALPPAQREFQTRGTDLLAAVEKLDLVRIDALVRAGTKLNQRYGRLGATPLNSSVVPGMDPAAIDRARAVQARLVQLGADPNFREGGIMQVPSGFREAVFGYATLIAAMLERIPAADRGAYLDFQGPLNGYTKLIDAATRGKAEVIEVLVSSGADLRIRGHNGIRAIEAARMYNGQSPAPLPQRILELLEPARR